MLVDDLVDLAGIKYGNKKLILNLFKARIQYK